MTTIAIDKNYMLACDGRSTIGDIICNKTTPKIFRVEDDFIAGAGRYVNALEFVEWYKDRSRKCPNVEGTTIIVLLSKKKKLLLVETSSSGNIHMTAVDVPFALGTGGQLALGAMLAGKNAKDAILIAAQRDVYTNNKVKVYNK